MEGMESRIIGANQGLAADQGDSGAKSCQKVLSKQ